MGAAWKDTLDKHDAEIGFQRNRRLDCNRGNGGVDLASPYQAGSPMH
jgi:hypothetical protein